MERFIMTSAKYIIVVPSSIFIDDTACISRVMMLKGWEIIQ
jgi:hypothetical protein